MRSHVPEQSHAMHERTRLRRVSYTYVGYTYAAVSESVPRALSMFYGSTERNFFKDQNLDIASLLQRPFNAGAAGGGQTLQIVPRPPKFSRTLDIM